MKKEQVRINQQQCKAGDTVPGSMGEPRGNLANNIKIDLINDKVRRPISEIKLIRTDTTLDLSQRQRELERKLGDGFAEV